MYGTCDVFFTLWHFIAWIYDNRQLNGDCLFDIFHCNFVDCHSNRQHKTCQTDYRRFKFLFTFIFPIKKKKIEKFVVFIWCAAFCRNFMNEISQRLMCRDHTIEVTRLITLWMTRSDRFSFFSIEWRWNKNGKFSSFYFFLLRIWNWYESNALSNADQPG